MKKYTKPMLMTLTISANDMLCRGCSANAADPGVVQSLWLIGITDLNGDGRIDASEIGDSLFASGDSCTDTTPENFVSYCKMSPEDNRLFVS